MTDTLQQYGTGIGIPLGAAIGALTAILTGTSSELGLLAGFGVSGGLVVGGFAGWFADSNRSRENWGFRVTAFTLFVSLLVGGLIGALAAWSIDGPLTVGFLVGSGAGGAFSLFLSAILISTARRDSSRPAVDSVHSEE